MSRPSQHEYWNEIAGPKWLRNHARLSALLQPYQDALLARSELAPGMRVVDVGCGMGSLTAALGARCGPAGVSGVDISVPMLEAARAAHPELRFAEADAQAWTPPEPVDRVVSRFGIMFFEDPPAAFANMRRWLKPGGMFSALAWREPERNPWITESIEIYRRYMPIPASVPGQPGPMSLADPAGLEALLREAGHAEVELEPLALDVRIEGEPAELLDFYCEWSPSSRFFDKASAQDKVGLRRDFEALVARKFDGSGLVLSGEVWAIQARG